MRNSLVLIVGALLCHVFFLNAWEARNAERHHDFIVVTPEKCGTHLLTKALEQLLHKNTLNCWVEHMPIETVQVSLSKARKTNSFYHMHAIPYKDLVDLLHKKHYKVIFLIRDPRDQAISLLHYIDQKNWGYHEFCLNKPYGQLNFNQKLMEIITGSRYGKSAIKHIMGRKMGWMFFPADFVYTVRFENLVGPEGGGTRKKQLMEIRNIAKFLDLELTDEELQERSQGLFGQPGETTFRNGRIGEWRHYFNKMHYVAFKTTFGKELIEMGYEKDLNW